MSQRVSALGEDRLIRRVTRGIRTDASVLRGIGDDCAVLALRPSTGLGTNGHTLLFASDMLVEGTHFTRGARPEAVGWKALAVNVSDVAAMAGVPRWAVVSLGLPRSARVEYVEGLYRGLRRCARRFGVNLVGGDTVRAPRVTLDVAIIGEVEKGRRAVLRSGARPGDVLLVTGRLGGAVRSGRHLTFTPRLREARALAARARGGLHAMMDLSDGLRADLPRMCRESGAGAVLETARIPRARGCTPAQALADGEDFELLLAVAPAEEERLLRWARRGLSCGLTRVGRVVEKSPGAPPVVTYLDENGQEIKKIKRSFSHF